MRTRSTTSRFGSSGPPLENPEHLHVPAEPKPDAQLPWLIIALHSSDSSHTGANCGPSRAQSPDGIGFLRYAEPAGTVPSRTSQPRAAASNSS